MTLIKEKLHRTASVMRYSLWYIIILITYITRAEARDLVSGWYPRTEERSVSATNSDEDVSSNSDLHFDNIDKNMVFTRVRDFEGDNHHDHSNNIDSIKAPSVQDIFNVIVSFVQAAVAIVAVFIYHKQAKIMDRTRYIAQAALERPYINAELVYDNVTDWLYRGKSVLVSFRLVNYGKSPAFIKSVSAWSAFCSNAQTLDSMKNEKEIFSFWYSVQEYPSADELKRKLAHSRHFYNVDLAEVSDVGMIEQALLKSNNFYDCESNFTISGGERTSLFVCRTMMLSMNLIRTAVNDVRMALDGDGAALCLFGRIEYKDMYGMDRYTNFSVQVHGVGGFRRVRMEGGPPYNEQT